MDDERKRETRPPTSPDAHAAGERTETVRGSSAAEQPLNIGRYRILEVIGEGGMGVVYRAEQREPVQRQVALKVIKLGMDTKEVVVRFEAERQALAVMDHPNIAHVYDAGATESGRPYFVMELVHGIQLLAYCDQHKLPTKARLKLFIQICEAVQHAHQKGVIHRDLKPSNILVSLAEGRPVPKIIDFGVAKATGHRLTEKTMFTSLGQLIGTPEYMSPEQAELSGLDVDTRSDIYALGVVLYELLAGALPFNSQKLRSVPFTEMQRMIREVEPSRPSLRLTDLGERTARVAEHRGTEVRTLRRELRGDLDWVVMKALEKDRTRRYDTAQGLALDIERYLDNEPVQARPPSAVYRFRKFVRRNKAGAAVGAALIVALLSGVIATTATLVGVRRAAAETEKEAEKTAAVKKFLEDTLTQAHPRRAQGREVTLSEALDAAAANIEAHADQPEIEADIRATVGMLYRERGDHEAAAPHLHRARELRLQLRGPDDPSVMHSTNEVGILYANLGRYAEAKRLFAEFHESSARVNGPDDPRTLAARQNVAAMVLALEQYEEAEALLVSVLEDRKRVLGDEHSATLATMSNLGVLYTRTRRYDQAQPLLERTLEIRRKVMGNSHPRTLYSSVTLGDLYNEMGRLEEAEQLFRAGFEGLDRVSGSNHPNTLEAMRHLLDVSIALGRAEAIEILAEDCHSRHESVFGADDGRTREVTELLARAEDR